MVLLCDVSVFNQPLHDIILGSEIAKRSHYSLSGGCKSTVIKALS